MLGRKMKTACAFGAIFLPVIFLLLSADHPLDEEALHETTRGNQR
jgi:hypothetical protein